MSRAASNRARFCLKRNVAALLWFLRMTLRIRSFSRSKLFRAPRETNIAPHRIIDDQSGSFPEMIGLDLGLGILAQDNCGKLPSAKYSFLKK